MTLREDMGSQARRALALLVVLTLGAAACGDGDGDRPAKAPKSKPEAKAKAKDEPAAPAGEAKPATEWSYSPIGKRDPFRSYIADMRELARAEDERKPETTEKFELDQYRLTGLVTGTSQPQAMVEDPEGVGHVLRMGARLGKNGGRVTKIGTEEIIVTEEFRAPTGERVRVPITVRLPRTEIEMLSEQTQ